MDATFWSLVGLVIFLAIIFYIKIPDKIVTSLDQRADKIRDDLNEAKRLREEAQQLLAEYQRKRKEAEEEAKEIVIAAKKDADILKKEEQVKLAEYVARRKALAEQKITRSEQEAIHEVRTLAVEIALDAAEKLISDKITTATQSKLFKTSLTEIKERLN